MTDKDLISKLAYVPIGRPGFDALDMTAPVMMQLNPNGLWENSKPESLDEDRLKAVVQHLVGSRAIAAAQSYCSQCASENKTKNGGSSNYVPVIMMPIYPADQCPFDMECEVQKTNETDRTKRKAKKAEQPLGSKEDKEKRKQKKRVYTLQRLTDFDLLSQW